MNSVWSMAALFRSEAPRLRRFLRRYGSDVSEEDIAQESFARLCAADQATIESPRAFLFRTAQNLALNDLRHRRALPMQSVADVDALGAAAADPNPEERLISAEELKALHRAVEAMPARQREALILFKIEGWSIARSARSWASHTERSNATSPKRSPAAILRCAPRRARTDRLTVRGMAERLKPTDAEIEASQWLVRIKSPEATLDDHRRLRAWLDADAAHRAMFEEIAGTWARLDALKHVPRGPPRKLSRRALAIAGIAAAASMLVFASLRTNDGVRTYASGVGEIISVALPDGSTAELSADTEIKAAFASDERRILLDDGEALFVVRADPDRPFVVVTPFGEARARGTTFTVRVGTDAMRTTVVEGTVEGRAQRNDPMSSALRFISDGRQWQTAVAVAQANQEFLLDGEQSRAAAALSADVIARRLAWREGMLAFDGEPLAEAVRQVTRHTGVRFEFADRSLGQIRVGGYIRARDVEGFLRLLRENFHVIGESTAKDRVQLRRAA